MNILRLDSLGGASGDMLLGVFCGLGIRPETLEQSLHAVIPDHFHLKLRDFVSHGITGVQATVELHHESEPEPSGATPHDHNHDHGHHHGHVHSHDHTHASHGPEHEHRTLTDILTLIQQSPLPLPVREASCRTFKLLAEAEGQVHGVPPEKVCFHEVGAVDSIVDIVGCHLAYHLLGVDAIALSPLPVGNGVVHCAHGVMPVPAPATAELLKQGLAVAPSEEPFELLTPTGAALLLTWPHCTLATAAQVKGTVNSFGQRKLLHTPNLLRGMLLATAAPETAGTATPSGEEILELECDIDDATGEMLGAAFERLFAAGALDVRLLPEFMKKQRPAQRLSLSCRAADRDTVLQTLFRETTTFGVREYPVRRHCLERSFRTVSTPYGPIRIKIGVWQGQEVSRAPEFEDCRAAAERCSVPVRRVLEAAAAVAACPGEQGGRNV